MSEFMCCATVCCEAMKLMLIVNLSKTKESSTLSEVPVQICLIIFMFQYFCVSLITMQQIITHSHSWIVYILSSTISWLFKVVTKKKYKNWLLFWWRWVFFFYSSVSTLMVQMTMSCPLSLEMSVLRAHSIDSASHSFHLPLFMLTLLVSILQILQIISLFQAFSEPNKAR